MKNPLSRPTESVGSGEDVLAGGTHGTTKRRRPKKLILSAATAFALVVGAGGAWATTILDGDYGDPQERLPETTAAFATLDFGVSDEQREQALDLVAKFPETGIGDEPQEAVMSFLELLETGNQDFADGKFTSWLGPSASIAMWQHQDAPYALATVPSIDDDAANEGLKALQEANGIDQVGFQLSDGYATIAFGEQDAQTAAEAASAEAEKAPLSESDTYAEASEFLGEDQILTAWADLEQANAILEQGLPEQFQADIPFDLADIPDNLMQGQVAFGAKAQEFGIEGVSHTFGAENVPEGKGGMLDQLSTVPESDIAGVLAVPEDAKDSVALFILNELLGMNTDLDNIFLDKLFDMMSGTSGAIGVSGIVEGVPTGQGSVDLNSEAEAHALKALLDLAGPALDTSVDGTVVSAGTSGYGDKPALSENPYYAEAVGGAPENLNGAVFFDIQKLLPAEAKVPLSALKAGAITLGNDDGESVGNYRLIIE